jgi:lysine 6-dehydrogenase
MNKTYAILGSGMQGTAAAYDLALYAEPQRILLADASAEQAMRSADRVNGLVGREVCEPHQVDALDPAGLGLFLKDVDVLLSCVPYWMHPRIAKVAMASETHMCDLGGNTDVTLETLSYDEEARHAGVTLIPDCGLAPGLVNSVGLFLIEQMDTAHSVRLYCGVLPQHPKPPFNYKLTFNVQGLVTEYDYKAVALRDGEIVWVDTLADLETIEVDELGTMEAFTTSGGTSTAPYTLKGRVRDYEYKTIRWPGHCERMRIFKDFGLWGEEPVDIKGVQVRPKDVFCRVFGEALAKIKDQDQCAVRGVAVGERGGQPVRVQADIFDKQCPLTGFTSMERLTGFSLAIHALELAKGGMPTGALRYETALTGTRFCEEIQRRGIRMKVTESVEDPREPLALS